MAVRNKRVPMWKIHQVLDLLYKENIRYFIVFTHPDLLTPRVMRRVKNEIRLEEVYPAAEWQAVLDNLEELDFASLTCPIESVGGTLILYILPNKLFPLPEKVLKAL